MTINKPILFQANWQAPVNIHTCITTNVEINTFTTQIEKFIEGFNLAMHVDDDSSKVAANREILNQFLPAQPLWLNQTHSAKIINWDLQKLEEGLLDADASITTKNNFICAILTADCLPILLTNKQGDFVAAIHAGWRGLNDGIIEKTIAELNRFTAQNMLAFIGPAICHKCFEISQEVCDKFLAKDATIDQYFIPGLEAGKYYADLRQIAQHKLIKQGLSLANITNADICTKCNPHWFYSYRAKAKTGRFATLIWKS